MGRDGTKTTSSESSELMSSRAGGFMGCSPKEEDPAEKKRREVSHAESQVALFLGLSAWTHYTTSNSWQARPRSFETFRANVHTARKPSHYFPALNTEIETFVKGPWTLVSGQPLCRQG